METTDMTLKTTAAYIRHALFRDDQPLARSLYAAYIGAGLWEHRSSRLLGLGVGMHGADVRDFHREPL